MSLHLKYRPNSFEEIQGNKTLISSLQTMLNERDCPHSFLFHGPTGCGKTTLARIIANQLGCKGNDYREVDSADFRGIDTAREIRKQSQFRPLESPCRVWVIDEIHKMTNDAQNAMLKILEDTPPHVYFILCTTNPHKLIPTIRGRCSQYQVRQLTEKEMFKLLRHVIKQEDEKIERVIYEQIIQDSLGHPRNALQILEQVLSVKPEHRLAMAKKTAEESSQVIELCRALIRRAGWKEIALILRGLEDQDPESVRRAVLGYCQAILLKEANNGAWVIMEHFKDPFYDTLRPGLIFACYSVFQSK